MTRNLTATLTNGQQVAINTSRDYRFAVVTLARMASENDIIVNTKWASRQELAEATSERQGREWNAYLGRLNDVLGGKCTEYRVEIAPVDAASLNLIHSAASSAISFISRPYTQSGTQFVNVSYTSAPNTEYKFEVTDADRFVNEIKDTILNGKSLGRYVHNAKQIGLLNAVVI